MKHNLLHRVRMIRGGTMALVNTDETVIEVETEEGRYAEMGTPYKCASKKNMEGMLEFYRTKPGALLRPITSGKDTAFHFAACNGKKALLESLLAMLPSSSQVCHVLLMKNSHGNTPLHEVAVSGDLEATTFVVDKLLEARRQAIHEKERRWRDELLGTKNNLGETAAYRAAALGKTNILSYLIGKVEGFGDIDDHFYRNDEVSILHIAVIGQQFDTAIWLMNKNRDLATKKLKTGKTCLHLLAGMPFAFHLQDMSLTEKFIYEFIPISRNGESQLLSSDQSKVSDSIRKQCILCLLVTIAKLMRILTGTEVYRKITNIKKMKEKRVLAKKLVKMLVQTDLSWEKIHQPREEITIRLDKDEVEEEFTATTSGPKSSISTPLLTAAGKGIVEIVDEMLRQFPQAIENTNENGENILQVAIKNRQLKVFKRIKKMKWAMRRLVSRIDNNGYTILHHAAKVPTNLETHGNDAYKLQEELLWFQRAERLLTKHCSHYVMHLNEHNLTAEQLLKLEQDGLLKLARKWMKESAQSCSAVSALIATIAFAAIFTLPGGLDESFRPQLRKKVLFKIFIVADAVSMAASLTSLVVFLSILSSSYLLEDFRVSLPHKLTFGLIFLFLSVLSAMLAFTSTLLLLVHWGQWTTILVYAAAFLPIFVFGVLQLHLLVDFLSAYIKEPYEDLKTKLLKKLNLQEDKDN